jgi:class 3 adenylate cyclase
VDYPPPITAYLLNRTAGKRHLVYFRLDDNGRVVQWGGALEHYRIQTPCVGMPVSQLLTCTEGLFPMPSEELLLECVALSPYAVVDLHFFSTNDQLWLLLLDASGKAEHQRLLQQKANELVLLRDAHARLLDQHLGKGMTERLLKIGFDNRGERRELSVLFADIRGFTAYCEHRPPVDVFDMLNAYLAAMIRPVLDGGGVVDKIVGDAVMAVFGLLPSGWGAPDLAVATAREILKRTAVVAADRQQAGHPVMGVGVGIGTGPVVLGVLGSKDRRTLSVTGHSVNLAARLESRAAPGEILMDARTADLLTGDRTGLTTKVLDIKGMDKPITAFGWVVDNER